MSNSSPSPQPTMVEQAHESDVVPEDSPHLNQETLNYSDLPPPSEKSDSLTQPPPDREDNCPEEEEEDDDDGGEADEGHVQATLGIPYGADLRVDPTITDAHVSTLDVNAVSLSIGSITRRGAGKRKKGKGKGKLNLKKQQVIVEKTQALMANLNPIPFIPSKIPDFSKHEKLLTKLGLWDFVHIDLDRNIRVELVVQLIATYDPKARASYVEGFRIAVSRPDLCRAFKLPVKKGNSGGVAVDLEQEPLSDESIGFISELVSDWLLLHEDTWMMPNEVAEWFKLIRDGHPEKVDWASLFWFMVEKELKQGGQLRDCHYASHLQHLIKCQRKELLLSVQSKYEHAKEVDLGVDEGDDIDVNTVGEKINNLGAQDSLVEGPSTELTLGQDDEREDVKDVEMVDVVEKCKDVDGDEVEEDVEEDEEETEDKQGEWLLNGKNDVGEYVMRRCGAENAEAFGRFEEIMEEEEEEIAEEEVGEEEEEDGDEDGNNFGGFPSHDDPLSGDGFTGNLLQAMEENPMGFNLQDQLPGQSPVDMRVEDMPSFFNNTGKRVLEHNETQLMHHPNEGNKKLRISNSWDHKHVDFGMCLEQIQQTADRARLLYEEKTHALEQSNMNQQLLLSELQKRDSMIEHLHKTQFEEVHKKDMEIYRLERELYVMGDVLDGYRMALKETQRSFAEYREKARLSEEPTYKDVGPGGLMLTAGEIEKLHKKQKEEFRMNCLMIEQKVKEVVEFWDHPFSVSAERVCRLEKKLMGLEADAKELIGLRGNRKTKQIEETRAKVLEPQTEEVVTEALQTQSEEKMFEAEELPSIPLSDENEGEAEKQPMVPQSEEKVAEAEEQPAAPQSEENEAEAVGLQSAPQFEEKDAEAVELLSAPQFEEKELEAEEDKANA